MPGNGTHVTIDHEEIRRWAASRGAKPSVVQGVRGRGPGIIRLDVPGDPGESRLREIDWDAWFDQFDASNLALLYQDKTARGQRSHFNKLVGRELVDLESGDTKAAPPRRRRAAGLTATRSKATLAPKRRPRKPPTSRGQLY